MGLDDLGDNQKEKKKQEQAESVAEKLGVESKEDLDELEDRIQTMAELIISMDKKLEEIETRLNIHEKAIVEGSSDDDSEEDGTSWTTS